jgi:hypothetical protein
MDTGNHPSTIQTQPFSTVHALRFHTQRQQTKPELHQTNTSQTHKLNHGRPPTEPGTIKKHHTPQARVIFYNEEEKTFTSKQTIEVVRPSEFINSTNGGQGTQHPHQLRTKDFYHASILKNSNKNSFILISSTIHPNITPPPTLPSKPSKSGFYMLKHPM